MNFHIITILPNSFSYLNESMLFAAQKNKKIKIKIYDLRDFTKDKHRKVDYKPYGGGPGMVIYAEPILRAVDKIKKGKNKPKFKIVILSPGGKEFNNKVALSLSRKYTDIILIAGHYEGIDARVKKALRAEEYTVGPYVLTGGELPAMIMVDAISRQIEGVLGNIDSLEEKRVSTSEVYTRPEVLKYGGKNYKVPKILLSGHHKKIEEWKKGKS